ncbi:MAG: hypothetical protein FJ029_01840, partial [Actinobacteria bacterium]|nr:hypothetical protein [Actinomycetota bacterium]
MGAIGPAFPLIDVSGDAYALGRQHGEQAAGMIHRYLGWIERLTAQPAGTLRDNALRFLPYLQRLSPRFVAEVRGLADGAKIAFADALLCQARAEAAQTWDGGCTAGSWPGKTKIWTPNIWMWRSCYGCARTMDVPGR